MTKRSFKTLKDFEELVNHKKMKIVARRKLRGFDVLVAEGFSRGDSEDSQAHYKTLCALFDGENIYKYAEYFTARKSFEENRRGILTLKTPNQQERIADAVQRAADLSDAYRRVGCLT